MKVEYLQRKIKRYSAWVVIVKTICYSSKNKAKKDKSSINFFKKIFQKGEGKYGRGNQNEGNTILNFFVVI